MRVLFDDGQVFSARVLFCVLLLIVSNNNGVSGIFSWQYVSMVLLIRY